MSAISGGRLTAVLIAVGIGLAPIHGACAQTPVGAEARQYTVGSDLDPQVRLARFYQGEDQYFSASSTLTSIEARQPGLQFPSSFYHRLAETTLAFGLPARAEHNFREAAPNARNPVVLGQSQLQLAEQLYAHARYDDALQLLRSIRQALPSSLFVAWQDLTSRTYLALDRNQDAIDVLTKPDNDGDQSPYERYNLGIALMRVGRTKDGSTALNEIGRMSVVDSDTLALRDKANLVLGYHYLRQKEGGTAIRLFRRVRLTGPYSNRALLGLGWAELTSNTEPKDTGPTTDAQSADNYPSLSTIGALVRPGFLDSVINRSARLRQLRHLHLKDAAPGREAALRRALVPWSALLSRDPMDPAVQECMLAVPYALDQIGAHIEAQEYYEKAVDALNQSRSRLDQAKLNIKSDRMVDTIIKRDEDAQGGWQWRLTDLPDAVETFYLQRMIADHPYQDTIKNYRDLQLMQRRLDTLDTQLKKLQKNYQTDARSKIPLPVYVSSAHNGTATGPAANDGTGPVSGPQLRMSNHLSIDRPAASAPASSDGNIIKSSPLEPLPGLELASLPANFEGIWEHILSLRNNIATLRPMLKQQISDEHQRLQKIALQDLDQQGKVATRYLVQARFALARLYDAGGPTHDGDAP